MENDILKQEVNPAQIISTSLPAKAPNHGNKLLLVIGVFVLLVLFCGVAYFSGTKNAKVVVTDNQEQPQEKLTNNSPTPITKAQQTPLFSGQLNKLSQNLMIFKITEDDKLNNVGNDFVYYEAGKFSQGELKDYSRIIAVRPSVGPGQPLVFVLATKDYKSYILDDPNGATTKYPEGDWQNPYNYLDKSKVISAKTFETEQPREMNLDKSFSLYSEEFPTESVQTNKIDKNGNKIYETSLITNFSSYQKLTSSLFNNLTIYFKPRETNTINLNQMTPVEKEKEQLRQKYLLGTTEVIVVDSAGLPIVYSLTTPDNVKNYNVKLTKYEADWKIYQDQLKKFENKQISQYPPSPDYVYPPNMGFLNSQITSSQNNLKFYHDYETAIPGACAMTYNSNVVNLSDSDFEQVGSVYNLPLYRLKDKNHPLYTLAFKNKMDYYE